MDIAVFSSFPLLYSGPTVPMSLVKSDFFKYTVILVPKVESYFSELCDKIGHGTVGEIHVVVYRRTQSRGGTRLWFGRGCAARASKPLPFSKGHFDQKRYPFLRIFRKI